MASHTVRKIKMILFDNFTFNFPLALIHNKTKKTSIAIKYI